METDALEPKKSRIEWDIYESVLLLDAVIAIYEKGEDRAAVISNLSSFLRQRATLNGLEIDSVFRNENGIKLQMELMKYGLYNIENSKTSKIFFDACELYKHSKEEYTKLLETAKQLPISHTILKEKFFAWLRSEINTDNTETINSGFIILDEFCKKQKPFYKSFYCIHSERELGLLIKLLQDDKEFIQYITENQTDIISCLTYFTDYLKKANSAPKTEKAETDNITKNIQQETLPLSSQLQHDLQDKNNFLAWMNQNGMAPRTASNYQGRIGAINSYAISQNYCEKPFSQLSVAELKNVQTLLKNDIPFSEKNAVQHNGPNAALSKYIAYRENKNFLSDKSVIIPAENTRSLLSEVQKEQYEKVLEQGFQQGLSYTSTIHLRKFKNIFQQLFGEQLTKEEETLKQELQQAGIIIEEKLFPSSKFKNSSLLFSILDEIQTLFEQGVSCIFADCLYEKYCEQLSSELTIYTSQTLTAILCIFEPNLIVKRNIFYSSPDADYQTDIINFFKNQYVSVSCQKLKEIFWYIPLENIKKTLVKKEHRELVNVDAETYFYAPNISLSSKELEQIQCEMKKALYEKEFIVAKDLPQILKKANHSLELLFQGYKDWAVREILKYFLCDIFSFKSVITEKGTSLSYGSLYKSFCNGKTSCTVAELKEFSKSIDTQIYWESILSVMVRVNKNLLVHNKEIDFDCEAFDNEIEKQCVGDYIPLQEIGLYEHFPVTSSYKCNGYLLESYLLNHSKKFFLVNASIAEKGYYGIVVRKSSSFSSYEDVITDLLSQSSNWTNAESALDLLVQKGCQARRTLDNIEKIVQSAQTKKKENKDIY